MPFYGFYVAPIEGIEGIFTNLLSSVVQRPDFHAPVLPPHTAYLPRTALHLKKGSIMHLRTIQSSEHPFPGSQDSTAEMRLIDPYYPNT